ncbi:MAG: hypothetical protein Q9164_005343 [Protoblastenia rupestris]
MAGQSADSVANKMVPEEPAFPWHLGVYDAHCHPTDTAASLEQIPRMRTRALTIMATRGQDQDLVAHFADKLYSRNEEGEERRIIPAFGWHPWFSHQIYDDQPLAGSGPPTRQAHYQRVLTPPPEDEDFICSLPEPRPLSGLLRQIGSYLGRYPLALVGEIGLDRAFRVPGLQMLDDYEEDPAVTSGSRAGRRLSPYRVKVEHQQRILNAQLRLAGKLQRAVSVHGVAAHGVVYETLAQTWLGYKRNVPSKRERKRRVSFNAAHEDDDGGESEVASSGAIMSRPYPPRICLHSYSGTPDTLRQYLQPSVPATIFFSFSRLVNFCSSPSDKAVAVIRAIPEDRILAESDLHAAGDRMDELMEEIVRTICQIKAWPLEQGVKQLALNWKNFVFGEGCS